MSFRPTFYPCPNPLRHPEHQHTEGPDAYMYVCKGEGIFASPAPGEPPPGWRTYAPDATECTEGHPFRSEADTVLPEGWDNFLCRQCVLMLDLAVWVDLGVTKGPGSYQLTCDFVQERAEAGDPSECTCRRDDYAPHGLIPDPACPRYAHPGHKKRAGR